MAVSISFLIGNINPTIKPTHRLDFDYSFVQMALKYLESGDDDILITISQGPAAAHLWRHSRDMNPQRSAGSRLSLVKALMVPHGGKKDSSHLVKRNIAYARKYLVEGGAFIQAALSLLPPDYRLNGSLFFTYGYDIGVAHGGNASLNLVHTKFLENPKEIVFYAAHELHHIGFMKYHPFPVLNEMKTVEDLVFLIEYATQMEGMAVYAAYGLRAEAGALNDDEDYIALQDRQWIRDNESIYFSLYNAFVREGTRKIRNDDWDTIEIFSDKKRLWYRIGCWMAMRIEEEMGRDHLVQLVQKAPSSFIQTYLLTKSEY